MALIKIISTPNGGSCSFHTLASVEFRYPFQFYNLNVHSWVNEQAYFSNQISPTWSWMFNVPCNLVLRNRDVADFESAIVLNVEEFISASVVPTPSIQDLATVKSLKNAEINQSRLIANRSYFIFEGKEISCDPLSRGDIDGINGAVSLLGSLPDKFPGVWKAKDNTYVQIADLDTWKRFYFAMVSQGSANFEHSQKLKSLVDSCTSVDEVLNINWNTEVNHEE